MLTEAKLDLMLTTPSARMIEDVKKIKGDIIILGAGGKMGPTLAILAKNAFEAAGCSNRVIAVSRFSDPFAMKLLNDNKIECISCDMMEHGAVDRLPDCENVIYMAGKKFGTSANSAPTWAMNAWLPALVAERYQKSNIVVFSSANIYRFCPISYCGADENASVEPVGEYAQSVLAREKMFEYGSMTYGTKTLMYRLSYACDMRYGVLHDIAQHVLNDEPVGLDPTAFACIWQGDANEIAIRGLLHVSNPAAKLVVTGPECVSIRKTALKFGELFNKKVIFTGEEQPTALLADASKCCQIMGYPSVSMSQMIAWQAEYLLGGGRTLNKPTHYEERKGDY